MSVRFNVEPEEQSFEKLFIAILFHSLGLGQKNAEGMSLKGLFINISKLFEMFELGF